MKHEQITFPYKSVLKPNGHSILLHKELYIGEYGITKLVENHSYVLVNGLVVVVVVEEVVTVEIGVVVVDGGSVVVETIVVVVGGCVKIFVVDE